PSKKPEDKHLHYFEYKRLIEELQSNLNTPMDYLLLLGLTTGCRFAEMVGLTKEDFNFKTNEIIVNKTWGYTKKMPEGFGPTKNRKSRTIKMNPKTMTLFKPFIRSVIDNIHGLVFFSQSSKYYVLSNGGANKALEVALNKLNISPISMHGLRHTHASV